jgi:hypothetical protein
MPFGPFSAAVALFAFLAVSAVAGIVGDYKKRKLALEPLRAAIERGQPLDPQIVERLMAPERAEGLNPTHLRTGGIITTSVGVGLAVLAPFIAQSESLAFYPLLGSGALVVCIGLGLIIAARSLERHASSQSAHGPAA